LFAALARDHPIQISPSMSASALFFDVFGALVDWR
jgi:hypothetical protein